MSLSALADTRRHLAAVFDALRDARLSADERLAAVEEARRIVRAADRFTVDTTATLQREGVFAERGYADPARALTDRFGWDRVEARRRAVAAEHVTERVGLDGTPLPPKLEATAAAFTAERIDLRHVEVIARVLGSGAAQRLTPDEWAGAEAEIADYATKTTPAETHAFARQLVEALDQDGAEPDLPDETNELLLIRDRHGSGGRIAGHFASAADFDAIATVIDALAKPRTRDDRRGLGRRQADALAEACRHLLDHGDVPETGGRRPQVTVLIRLDDLENRARAAALDFGGTLSPADLRMLCCDAAVIPVVLGGKGQPLDVGRATRTIPDGLRRAVTGRDRGCAFPGCDRPPSWSDIHHIVEWERGGETALHNLVMLCRLHHRQVHHTGWVVRLRDGLPEFTPPAWIDPRQEPRRRRRPHLVAGP